MSQRFRWLRPRHIVQDLLALDDRPHAIALGAAIGIWLGLTPTVGVQMVLVFILAACTSRVMYFNRTAALLGVYVTNPLTIVPIYWFNYLVGAALLGNPETADESELAAALDYDGIEGWWDTVTDLASRFGIPMLVGSLVVASLAAAVTYPLVRWMVRTVRVAADLDPGDDDAATTGSAVTSEISDAAGADAGAAEATPTESESAERSPVVAAGDSPSADDGPSDA